MFNLFSRMFSKREKSYTCNNRLRSELPVPRVITPFFKEEIHAYLADGQTEFEDYYDGTVAYRFNCANGDVARFLFKGEQCIIQVYYDDGEEKSYEKKWLDMCSFTTPATVHQFKNIVFSYLNP